MDEKDSYTPEDVLSLDRNIIQHASRTIIELLADVDKALFDQAAQTNFTNAMQQMLSCYMSRRGLDENKDTMTELTSCLSHCA